MMLDHTEDSERGSQVMSHSSAPGATLHMTIRSERNERDDQEDSYHVFSLSPGPGVEPIHVLALSDGMGGHAQGEAFSLMALSKLAQALFDQVVVQRRLNTPEAGQVRISRAYLEEALGQSVVLANSFVQRGMKTRKIKKAGATLVVALIHGDEGVVTNLGDSPLYHRPAGGRLLQVTENHTVAEALLKAEMITPEMAQHHAGRNALQFHMGSEYLPDPLPIRPLHLGGGDLILLCSDGVCGDLEPAKLDEALGEASDLEAAADRLIEQALEAGQTDNQTLILWRHPARGLGSATVLGVTGREASSEKRNPGALATVLDLGGSSGTRKSIGPSTLEDPQPDEPVH